MDVSVEILNGLERKLTITVPASEIDEEVNLRLKDLARKVKLDGYRPGKAPLQAVKRRFLKNIHDEVARDMVQSTLQQAVKEKELRLAGYPQVEPLNLEAGKDFTYTATFEIYPTFSIKELENDKIEQLDAQVTDADVNALLEKMRIQDKVWEKVERPVAADDKIKLNFEGFVDDKPFEGGKAEGFDLTIGSGSMIPGFEDGLIGAELNKPLDLSVKFPENYHAKDLAGKDAVFKATVTEIRMGQLPALDDAYAEKYNVKEGGLEAFKKEIKENMEKELERKLGTMNREKIFDKMLAANPVDLPNSLVDMEIENLKHDFYHRVFGHKHTDNEKIPDFPRNMFETQAKRRVHLGLLFSEYIHHHKIEVDEARVDQLLDKLAASYEFPEEMRNYYLNHEERMNDLRNLVLEEMAAEKMAASAEIIKKQASYDDVMNPKPESKAESKLESKTE